MTTSWRIINGRVFDPANDIDGESREILVHEGRIVDALPDDASPRTLDATGLVIMPGGVDIHCHIASPSVNAARSLCGQEHATHVHRCNHDQGLRSGSGVLTPSTFTTGYQYAALGYTSALEAAVSPTGARQTHMQLADTPNLDAAMLLLLANHEQLIGLIDHDQTEDATAFIGQMLRRTGAWGIKVVNPGGVASWRRHPEHHTIETLDDTIADTGVTPRKILEQVTTAAEALGLPHAPHIHANRLGLPGNVEITLDTIDALAGRRAHLTHLQYHAYGEGDQEQVTSAVDRLLPAFAENPQLTADVGQVIFGDAVTVTADTPLEHLLWRLTGTSTTGYISLEGELESGCGVMPITYRNTHRLHALQWAIGLELMLGCENPWQMMLSTDHPNGGSFVGYPRIIGALMNRAVREEIAAAAPTDALASSGLSSMTREMTLAEIAVITRAAPARTLGLIH
ncbi:MAG: formylmethanofuran dehydrogenase subunit A, partial [Phycisphaeraceae bacterium]|nr:formylmethanofuran dehydrogenase subunit A [Phycisphaeraceae bacterium]